MGFSMNKLGFAISCGLVFVCLSCSSPSVVIPPPEAERLAAPKQSEIEAFVQARDYETWGMEPPILLTGARVDGVVYASHQYLQVHYSSGVVAWLEAGRPAEGPVDGSIIVALEYALGETPGPLERVHVKVRDKDSVRDGWFWSTVSLLEPDSSKGSYGNSSCMSCHGSAAALHTFLGGDGTPQAGSWQPDDALKWPDPAPPEVELDGLKALPNADLGFLELFGLADVPREGVVPFPPKSWDHVVSDKKAGIDGHEQQTFLTSDQCAGCHNAGQGLSNASPNMWYPNPEARGDEAQPYRNYSPYAEWSASLNGLAGRDPVWHAQVESERFLRPKLADLTDDVCFSCHGPMATRQIKIDRGPDALFTNDMFYAHPEDPDGKYGALSRDGVSCTTCHAIAPEGLGVDPIIDPNQPRQHLNPSQLETYTAAFKVREPGFLWGPYENDTRHDLVMAASLGVSLNQGKHMDEAKLCGSCHTVIVPALPVGYDGDNPLTDPDVKIAYEQTTYWEWRNSVFENERKASGLACQGCHMTPHEGKKLIANINSDRYPPQASKGDPEHLTLVPKEPYWRHTLSGLNLFVFNMYRQFPDLLGSRREDLSVPKQTLDPFLNARDWVNYHSENASLGLKVLGLKEQDGFLEAGLEVVNYSGHKVPTGAGFRRVFVEFKVLDDAGNVLWVSGQTNPYGVILDGKGQVLTSEFTLDPAQSQPHYQVIEREDQVQIYETRSLDSNGKLQTTVLGIFDDFKDNRLLPLGWDTEGPNIYATHPVLPGGSQAPAGAPDYCGEGYDPDYCEEARASAGKDNMVYRIPLDRITNWARVEAQLYYQTIPPYFLADRFRLGRKDGEMGRDTKRLVHMTSRLNLQGTRGENWKLRIGSRVVANKGAGAQSPTDAAEIRAHLKKQYPRLGRND